MVCGILVPWEGTEPCLLHWKYVVLNTEPPGKSLDWNFSTLATWCEDPGSSEKTLILGKTEDKRRRAWQRMRWLDHITDSMGMNEFQQTLGDSSEGQGSLEPFSPRGHKELDTT